MSKYKEFEHNTIDYGGGYGRGPVPMTLLDVLKNGSHKDQLCASHFAIVHRVSNDILIWIACNAKILTARIMAIRCLRNRKGVTLLQALIIRRSQMRLRPNEQEYNQLLMATINLIASRVGSTPELAKLLSEETHLPSIRRALWHLTKRDDVVEYLAIETVQKLDRIKYPNPNIKACLWRWEKALLGTLTPIGKVA